MLLPTAADSRGPNRKEFDQNQPTDRPRPTMARTRQTGVHNAAADAAGAPATPPAVGEEDNDLLPGGEEEEEKHDHDLDNIDAHIRESMITMYAHVLGFKE